MSLAPRRLGEFDLIRRWFTGRGAARPDVAIGIGDDAAVVSLPGAARIVCAPATRVAADSFPEPSAAADLARAAVAAGAARVRAHGAQPAWCTLALTIPTPDPAWLDAFAGGLDAGARAQGIALVGGDTTRGPAAFTLVVVGFDLG